MKGDIRRFRSRDEGGAPVVLQTRAEMAAEEAELGVGRLTGEVAEVGRIRKYLCENIYLMCEKILFVYSRLWCPRRATGWACLAWAWASSPSPARATCSTPTSGCPAGQCWLGLVRTRHQVIVLQVLTALHVRGQSACGHCHICHWKVD